MDNSDYIAIQTYHRHQIPAESGYEAWDQYRDAKGKPLYPLVHFIVNKFTP